MPRPTHLPIRRLSCAVVLGLMLGSCKASEPPAQVGDCSATDVAAGGKGLSLAVTDRVVKEIGPEYFGFNLENSEFQLSLWDGERHQVRPEVSRYLKEHFAGAVYRYPGGTTSNYHRWKKSIGTVKQRKSVRINDWIDLPRIEFGVDEYLDFVEHTGGQAWYVLNIKGDIDRMVPTEVVAEEAADLVTYIGARKVPVVRWELGNELDRFEEKWPSERYVDRARQVMKAVRKVDADARFVSMMADFDAQSDLGISASQYNVALARGLKDDGISEFAQHLYYDGPPDGPPVPNRLHHLCQSIADAKTGGVTPERTGFWITEHARWPEGGGEGWNKNWRLSADLGAAISVADLLIASTQLPQVKGSGLHALHGTTGPWPMFHLPEGATTYHPSVPMHTYALLRETLLPQVLHTRNTSANPARYDGDYSARGTVMRSEDGRRYSVWSINRHGHPLDVELNIPALAGKQLKASLASIDGGADTVNNYDRQVVTGPTRQPVDLRFDDKGVARYVVPAHSVSGLSLALPAK